MSRIPCTSVCLGCTARNCGNCRVLREHLKHQPFVIESFDDNKKDFDLENHFAGGL